MLRVNGACGCAWSRGQSAACARAMPLYATKKRTRLVIYLTNCRRPALSTVRRPFDADNDDVLLELCAPCTFCTVQQTTMSCYVRRWLPSQLSLVAHLPPLASTKLSRYSHFIQHSNVHACAGAKPAGMRVYVRACVSCLPF